MADADIKFANLTTEPTATSATFTDAASLSTLTGSTEYLIIATLATKPSGGTSDRGGRLVYGSTPTVFDDAYGQYDPLGSDERWPHGGWLYRFTTASSPETIKAQFNLPEGTGTITHQLSQILAIKTADLGTEGTDWDDDLDTADTTDAASLTSRSSVTLTANGTDIYLVLGFVSWLEGTASGVEFFNQLYDNTSSVVLAETSWTGQDSTGDNFTLLSMAVQQPPNGSRTWQLRTASDTSQTLARTHLVVLNLSKLAADVRWSYASGSEDPAASPSWTTTRTLTFTPSSAGDYVIVAFAQGNASSTGNMFSRLQVDSSSNPSYGDDGPDNMGGGATPAAAAHQVFLNKVNLTAASHTINFDWQNADTSVVTYRTLVAFSVLKPTGGLTVYPPVISNTATIYAPTVRTTKVYAPLISNGNTIYAPKVNRKVTVGALIDRTAVIYTPTRHTTKVYAPVITQTATIYTPTVRTTKVYAPVITQTPTLYAPKVNRGVVAPFLDYTASIYTPEVQVEAAEGLAQPPFLNYAATIYTPAVHTTKVYVGVITQTATIYTPTVSRKVAVGIITQTATIYTPAVHTTKVYVPFLDYTAVIYTPSTAGAKVVEAPFLDYTASIYAPSLVIDTTHTPPVISQTPVLYDPTIQLTVTVPRITQTVTIYAPSQVKRAVAPPLLSYGVVYTPSVKTKLTVGAVITRTATIYTPQVLFPGPLTLSVQARIIVEPLVFSPQVHRIDVSQHQHRLRLRSERAGTVF